MSEILVKVYRNNIVESVHRGHLIVVDGVGAPITSIGKPEKVTFWRSAAKSLQAIPLVMSGAADAFGFTDKEIALACASHSGEDFHTDLCRQMLTKIGLEEKDLLCGVHPSFHNKTAKSMIKGGLRPTQLNNNCSGKHAGMLAFAKHIGADTRSYLSLESPVQMAILKTVSNFTDVPLNDIRLGTDGCSAPNFAVPLSVMAKAFWRLANPGSFATDEGNNGRILEEAGVSLESAARRIVSAQMKHPEYVGGSDRLDTKIMQALKGKMFCKIGAEGVWNAGVLPCVEWPAGLGIALKIEDGDDSRARPAVAVELLRQLGLMNQPAEEVLGEFSPIILKNRMDTDVGHVAAEFNI